MITWEESKQLVESMPFDAPYLELALRRRLPLVAFDAALAAAARAEKR
jgi:hypothetical protein